MSEASLAAQLEDFTRHLREQDQAVRLEHQDDGHGFCAGCALTERLWEVFSTS